MRKRSPPSQAPVLQWEPRSRIRDQNNDTLGSMMSLCLASRNEGHLEIEAIHSITDVARAVFDNAPYLIGLI